MLISVVYISILLSYVFDETCFTVFVIFVWLLLGTWSCQRWHPWSFL